LKNKVLIFGFGSIGIRHANLLRRLKKVSNVLIFSSRVNKKFNSTNRVLDILKYNPDYILVCSETSQHLQSIKIIEKNFKNKIVLVEKPLFHKPIKFSFKNNKYYIGYNLRFHPVIKFLKDKIKQNEIFSVSIFCNSFLPRWRKNIDYFNSYSSSKKRGGGVLLDLSHEIDYLQWLFGRVSKIEYKKIKRISNLKIKSEDVAQVIGKIKNINFYLNLTYFSRFEERRIIIDSKKETIIGDLINCNIKIINNNNLKIIKFKNNINQTYVDQHLAILNNQSKNLCNIEDAKNTISFIEKLKKKI
jgi:predicted dehydrogenase